MLRMKAVRLPLLVFPTVAFAAVYVYIYQSRLTPAKMAEANPDLPAGELEVVMSFPYLIGSNVTGSGYEHLNWPQRNTRQLEFTQSLRNTLNHPMVARAHLLIEDGRVERYIRGQRLDNERKARFHLSKSSRKPATVVRFVSRWLVNRTVIMMNADTYPGGGFEKINFTRFREARLAYALSRHGKQESTCNMSGDRCDDRVPYRGSHDAYMFVLREAIPEPVIRLLGSGFNLDSYGIDHVLCWIFAKQLRYRVLNPCKVVYIYHNHCSKIRAKHKIRVNKKRNTLFVPFTHALY